MRPLVGSALTGVGPRERMSTAAFPSACAGPNDDLQALVNYFGQREYFRHVQAACEHALQRPGPTGRMSREKVKFWRSIAIIQQGMSMAVWYDDIA